MVSHLIMCQGWQQASAALKAVNLELASTIKDKYDMD
jgi:hypothetical protein